MNTTYTSDSMKWVTGCLSWRMATMLSLMLLMLSWSFRNSVAQDVYVPASDSMALVAFYNTMSGEHWINKGGWLVDRVDTWHGIQTDNVGTAENPEWRVVQIELEDNMTQPGFIPPEIGDLEYLTDLVLRGDPSLFGEWPKEIENLVNIFEIRTQNTNMSGEIPWQELANTQSITRIRLQSAQHSGEIPDQIFSEMTQLVRLQLSDMYLSGNFPSSVADLENIQMLRIMQNLIEGDIPDLGHLENVEMFNINDQNLTPGPIWPWIQNWGETLESLILHNTNRTGTVPGWMATDLFALEELELGEYSWDLDNALGGELPDFSNLLDIQVLGVHGPHWEGDLPDWIGNINLDRIFFQNCSFSGSIPASYANLTDVVSIQNCPEVTGGLPPQFELFSGRDFVLSMTDSWNNKYERFGEEAAEYFSNPQMEVGDIPAYITNWSARQVTMQNVGLTGSIPSEMANMGGLSTLNLSHNPDLTGSLPAGLFDNLSISTLNVSHTGLDIDEVPAGLQQQEFSLSNLGLAGFGIEGEIPAFIGDLPLLQSLDLSDNSFTGPIPSGFGNLKLMNSLNMANNQLSGELPADFEDVGFLDGFYALNSLDLSGNVDLSGEIPQRFSQAELMLVMRYNDTVLRAPDNPAFSNWLENVIPSNTGLSFPPLYVDVQTSGLVGSSVEYSDNPYIFHLGANYPNPFNPTTTFSYQIPVEGHVKLSIYNVLGQEVVTLVNEIKAAGNHEMNFDASSLSSGAYLYRLKSGNQVMTRSMMLIK